MQGLTNGMQSMQGEAVGSAQSITQSIANTFTSIIDGSKKAKDAIADLLKQMAKMLIDNAMKSLFGTLFGGAGGSGGGLLSTLFGALPGFANGGSFKVGGAGGTDSQLVAFRASPSERVSISKPGQERGSGNPAPVIRINQSFAAGVTPEQLQASLAQTRAATLMAVRDGFSRGKM
jgi:hypothetical protein